MAEQRSGEFEAAWIEAGWSFSAFVIMGALIGGGDHLEPRGIVVLEITQCPNSWRHWHARAAELPPGARWITAGERAPARADEAGAGCVGDRGKS